MMPFEQNGNPIQIIRQGYFFLIYQEKKRKDNNCKEYIRTTVYDSVTSCDDLLAVHLL